METDIWFVATTKVGLRTWIWPTRHSRLRQEVACWFQCSKSQLFSFDSSDNFGAIDVKMDGSVLEEMLGLSFSSKFDWDSYIAWIAKTVFKKIGALIRSMKFISPGVALYLYKYTIRPCMEYCCHAWVRTPCYYLVMLSKLQKWIRRTVGPYLLPLLNSWLMVEMYPT